MHWSFRYNAADEADRKQRRETKDRILHLAVRKGRFEASLRYRDDWLRNRCDKLVREGLLTREPGIHNGKLIYRPVDGLDLV